MSVIIFLKEKSSGHGNVENSAKFPKTVSIKAFTLTFSCGKSVGNVWKTCGKLIGDYHCHHSMMRFIFHFDLSTAPAMKEISIIDSSTDSNLDKQGTVINFDVDKSPNIY